MRWIAVVGSLPMILAGICSPGYAAASRCEVEAVPSNPGASSEAFTQSDVGFSTEIHIQCFDDLDAEVAADAVCVSAQRANVSGSFQFEGNGRVIPYRVESNGIQISEIEQQIWSGSVPATGEDIEVSYEIQADDFVGFPGGGYYATTIWTADLDREICP